MAENVTVEHTTDSNGRRVETHVSEIVVDGRKERVIERHVEQIPMALSEKVTETIAPIVTTRKKEIYKDGKIIDSVEEELDHGTLKMKMSAAKKADALTKQDLMEVLKEVLTVRDADRDTIRDVRSVRKKNVSPIKMKASPPEEVEEEEEVPATPPVAVETSKTWEWIETGLYVLLSGELAYCFYQLVLKNWL